MSAIEEHRALIKFWETTNGSENLYFTGPKPLTAAIGARQRGREKAI